MDEDFDAQREQFDLTKSKLLSKYKVVVYLRILTTFELPQDSCFITSYFYGLR